MEPLKAKEIIDKYEELLYDNNRFFSLYRVCCEHHLPTSKEEIIIAYKTYIGYLYKNNKPNENITLFCMEILRKLSKFNNNARTQYHSLVTQSFIPIDSKPNKSIFTKEEAFTLYKEFCTNNLKQLSKFTNAIDARYIAIIDRKMKENTATKEEIEEASTLFEELGTGKEIGDDFQKFLLELSKLNKKDIFFYKKMYSLFGIKISFLDLLNLMAIDYSDKVSEEFKNKTSILFLIKTLLSILFLSIRPCVYFIMITLFFLIPLTLLYIYLEKHGIHPVIVSLFIVAAVFLFLLKIPIKTEEKNTIIEPKRALREKYVSEDISAEAKKGNCSAPHCQDTD